MARINESHSKYVQRTTFDNIDDKCIHKRILEDAKKKMEGRIRKDVQLFKKKKKKELDKGENVVGQIRSLFLITPDLSNVKNTNRKSYIMIICMLCIIGTFYFYEHCSNHFLGICTPKNNSGQIKSNLDKCPQGHILQERKTPLMEVRNENNNFTEKSWISICKKIDRVDFLIFASFFESDFGILRENEAKIKIYTRGFLANFDIFKIIILDPKRKGTKPHNSLYVAELIREHLEPPPASIKMEHTLIKVGFPHQSSAEARSSLCMCHLDNKPLLNTRGYYCPHCSAKYCDLPAECRVCGLMLVTAPHLARSYRHKFLHKFKHIPQVDIMSKACNFCKTSLRNTVSKIWHTYSQEFSLSCSNNLTTNQQSPPNMPCSRSTIKCDFNTS
ncbi:unnamed protein product, partial [Meganyctiphanes norvegica]